MSPAQSDTLVLDNKDDAHSYSDSEQEEDLDLQYMQTDYENNQIIDDICTTYICKRRLATDMCHDPVHDQGLEPGSPEFKLVSGAFQVRWTKDNAITSPILIKFAG